MNTAETWRMSERLQECSGKEYAHQVFRRQLPFFLTSVGLLPICEEAKIMSRCNVEYRAAVWCVACLGRGVLQRHRLDMPTFYMGLRHWRRTTRNLCEDVRRASQKTIRRSLELDVQNSSGCVGFHETWSTSSRWPPLNVDVVFLRSI